MAWVPAGVRSVCRVYRTDHHHAPVLPQRLRHRAETTHCRHWSHIPQGNRTHASWVISVGEFLSGNFYQVVWVVSAGDLYLEIYSGEFLPGEFLSENFYQRISSGEFQAWNFYLGILSREFLPGNF